MLGQLEGMEKITDNKLTQGTHPKTLLFTQLLRVLNLKCPGDFDRKNAKSNKLGAVFIAFVVI